jgi:hypothetical protein
VSRRDTWNLSRELQTTFATAMLKSFNPDGSENLVESITFSGREGDASIGDPFTPPSVFLIIKQRRSH